MNLRAFPHAGICGLAFLGFLTGPLALADSLTVSAGISDIEILIENVDSGKLAATRTGDSGQFSLSGLEPGEYRLIIGPVRGGKALPVSDGSEQEDPTPPVGYDVRLSVYGGAMTAQWVPVSSPKVRVGIVFAVPARASGTIAGSIRPATPPAVQTLITWVSPPAFE
ncbi:MAG: carboxypeptidase-like regulatory domain-containing protein [Opitutaceae bacterium]